jgi:hypothetical protein
MWLDTSHRSSKTITLSKGTSASALTGKVCPDLQKQKPKVLDIADVVRDVEKGTKTVIPPNFMVFLERKFNNLQTQFWLQTPSKEFFASHALFHQLTRQKGCRVTLCAARWREPASFCANTPRDLISVPWGWGYALSRF